MIHQASLVSIFTQYRLRQVPVVRLTLLVNARNVVFDVWDRIHAKMRKSVRVSHKKVSQGKNLQVSLDILISCLKESSNRVFVVEYINETKRFRITAESLTDWFETALLNARKSVLREKAFEEGIGEEELQDILSSIK